MTLTAAAKSPKPWAFRLALATWLAAVPLVLFGGTVTTLRAGMAESGWIRPDGYFLWAYPIDKRFGSLGVFVEHHHRELGSLVGLLSIATVIATWRSGRRDFTRWLPLLGLLAVCVQGLLGGLRVLENSPSLAFVHGALAQAVFAFLFAIAMALSPRYARAAMGRGEHAPGLLRAAQACAAVIFLQITLGAWLRHSGAELAMALHVLFAVAVVGSLAALSRRLNAAAQHEAAAGRDGSFLRAMRWRLWLLLGFQFVLGLAATFWIFEVSGGFQGAVSMGEAIFATGHVAVGALLLSQSVAAWMWARVLAPAAEARVARAEAAR